MIIVIFLSFALLFLPALYLTKGTHWLVEKDSYNTLLSWLQSLLSMDLDKFLDFLGKSPTLAYVVDVHHLNFDCCAYLLVYAIITEACWNFIMGIMNYFLKYFQPPDSKMDWRFVFLLIRWYHAEKVADAATTTFVTLGDTFSTDPKLPFPFLLPSILMFPVGFFSFEIGYILAFCLGMDVGAVKLSQMILGFAAAYPKTTIWATCDGLLFLLCLIKGRWAQNTPRAINGTPVSWIAYCMTNSLACLVRGKIAARRLNVSSSFLHHKMDQVPVFRYCPLPKAHFRLLKLDASRASSEQVVCSIEVHMQPSAPAYEAISYYWGKADMTCSITVQVGNAQKRQIKITKNAYDAIAALCPINGIRYLWIDIICINQDDPEEKDVQIPLMKDIFGEASRVIVHLGTPQYVSLANNFIARANWHRIGTGFSPAGVDSKSDNGIPFWYDIHGWRAVKELIGNNVWSRTWIVQEVVLAKRLFIHNGDSLLPWPFLFNFEKMFVGYNMLAPFYRSNAPGEPLFTQADIFARHNLMLDYRHLGGREEQKPLKLRGLDETLVDLRKFDVGCPEDKVNAILAISTAPYLHSLHPNHKKSVEEIYKSATLYTLHSGSFLLFSISGLCHERRLSLPSWVPDLSMAPWSYNDFRLIGYNAGTSTKRSHEISHHGQQLHLFGYIIDEVKACGKLNTDPSVDPLSLTPEDERVGEEQIFIINSPRSLPGELFRRLLEMLTILGPCGTLKDAARIVALTAVEDSDGKSFPVSEDMLGHFVKFVMFVRFLLAEPTPSKVQILRKLESPEAKLMWKKFYIRAEIVSRTRKFAVTQHGHAAMVPNGTEKGDVLCVFEGSPVPHVLRPARDGYYHLYGDAYVHGFMDGNALKLQGDWITLI